MLASLLPGLRSLRAPLAAGYIWLLSAWLLADDLPPREEATGLVRRLYELEGVVSEIGTVVALSFVAYLIGSVSETISSTLLRSLRRITVGNPAQHSYHQFIRRELRRWGERDKPVELSLEESEELAQGLTTEEFGAIRARLMAEQSALYGEYDRLRSEAEFRVAIVLPLVSLILGLGSLVHPAWGFAIIPLGLLVFQAAILQGEADQALIGAVVAGKVEAPFMTRLTNRLA
jgi:hypothetical protein